MIELATSRTRMGLLSLKYILLVWLVFSDSDQLSIMDIVNSNEDETFIAKEVGKDRTALRRRLKGYLPDLHPIGYALPFLGYPLCKEVMENALMTRRPTSYRLCSAIPGLSIMQGSNGRCPSD